MKELLEHLAAPGRVTACGAPEGRDALALAELRAAAPERDFLFLARDDAHLSRTAAALRFFAPDLAPLTLPAWDCLPYDRVSPRADIAADRLRCLSALASAPAGPPRGGGRLVLATVNAAIQKLPPRAALAGGRIEIRRGATLDPDALAARLESDGYRRVSTVLEPGEYAFRGGIVDLFPAGAAAPARIDLFGDEVESIRRFDPLSQRSTGDCDGLDLAPASEIGLDATSIARFRAGYRALFGAVSGGDALYEAVSAGRRHPGMEHWMPLFHDRLESLFDYLPDAPALLDHQADGAAAERRAQIADYYRARLEGMRAAPGMDAQPYKPVPPETLFLDEAAWEAALAARAAARFTPFREPGGVDLGARPARDFAAERERGDDGALYAAIGAHLRAEGEAGRRAMLACYSAGSRDRLSGLLAEHGAPPIVPAADWPEAAAAPRGAVAAAILGLERGFRAGGVSILSEQDALGDRLARPAARPRRAANFLTEASALSAGDLVVHIDHGIGRYVGLETVDAGGAPHDCLLMLYAGDDKLYLPVENIEMLSRYGGGEAAAALDRLGSANWQARKARLKDRLRDMADALIRTAAERQLRGAARLSVESGLYDEFAARFPFSETEDQDRAIDDCLKDLAGSAPMDRLVCGDVGYGKTEVALRAAFVAAFSGKQTAVVVPTTLLCRQHFATFSERFRGLPTRVAQLSRLVAAKEAGAARAGLADGSIDIVVGTHALLGKSVKFADLGLLVVDEEQRFGVAQKERLKALKADVHVLTLSATPIPRTLQLAVSGVRGLSLIATPPVDRLAVRTFVMPYDPVVVREAILRERHRGGQVFYVCPRIEDLDKVAAEIRRIAPDIRLVAAHGRMSARRLEEAMSAFHDGRYELLLSTSIIESGLDMPRVNTLIVHRADLFGLAQLYQLRGRVGRSKTRAYAYFTVRSEQLLKGAAEKRLAAIQALDALGAGFSLASHDLDNRGAGNLLGEEQSGHIREVGVELYQQLLEDAVREARAGGAEAAGERWSPQIALGMAVLLPEEYVADLGVRLGLYRRLAELETDAETEAFAAELIDRFGPLPDAAQNLLALARVKRLCRAAGVERLDAGPKGAVVAFRGANFAAPDKLVAWISRPGAAMRLRPDHCLVVSRPWRREADRLAGAAELMAALAAMAA